MRHDPDKIMVGEIRDAETAQIAIQSALTGHLVFTTVHANNVVDVLGRFLNMGVEPYNFVSALNCILAQRLVRVICEQCKHPVHAPPRPYWKSPGWNPKSYSDIFYEGAGCMDCGGTGFRGRTAIHELLDLSDPHSRDDPARRPTSEIKKTAREEGMRFLRECGGGASAHGTDDTARDQQGDIRRMSRRAFLDPPGLTTAIEIASHRVSAVRFGEQNERPTVMAHATAPLPAGVVVPSLMATNITNRETLVAGLTRVLGEVGGRASRVGLVLPDPVAKVSLVKFEKIPVRADDLQQLVRWQVRKTAPFQIDEAQVVYSKGALSADGGAEFLVALSRRSVIEEYESACASAGVHAGLVDLATFNIVNAVLAAGTAANDWLLVAIAPTYTTIAIVRGDDPIFFRSRPEGEGSLADLVHQTVMYYEDRLGGGGFGRILLSGAGTAANEAEAHLVQRELESRLGAKVESVDPWLVGGLGDQIMTAPSELDSLAPLIGMLINSLGRLDSFVSP